MDNKDNNNTNDTSKNSNEKKEKQSKLREIQLKRDEGKTYGEADSDPCKQERQMSYQCIEMNKDNSLIDCKMYFENFKKCKEFWVIFRNVIIII